MDQLPHCVDLQLQLRNFVRLAIQYVQALRRVEGGLVASHYVSINARSLTFTAIMLPDDVFIPMNTVPKLPEPILSPLLHLPFLTCSLLLITAPVGCGRVSEFFTSVLP